jgi:uncharacterized protein (DUF2384 family)
MTTQIAFSIFKSLTGAWYLTDQERATLLGIGLAKYDEWCRSSEGVYLSPDQARQVSYVIDIYDATHRMFGDAEYANDWVHRINSSFNGRAPLDVMLKDKLGGVATVHEHVQHIVANYDPAARLVIRLKRR